MTRLLWGFILCITVLVSCPVWAYGMDTEKILEKARENQISTLELGEWETYLRELDRDVRELVPDLSLQKIWTDMRSGQLQFNFGELFMGILRYFFRELLASSTLLGEIIILSIICVILQNLQAAFEKGTVGKVAYGIVFLVLASLALGSFTLAMDTGREAIDQMVSFVHALLPLLITLLTAVGGITTAALMHPFILIALGTFSTLIKNLVLPLIYFAAVLGIVSQLSERFQVSRMTSLFKQISVGLLSLFLTVFIGVLTIQGVAGSVADGIALRTVKFATGNFIPVVGKMLSDAVEAVAGTSLLLKNAVGLVGVLIILILAIFPSLKIISLVIIYKISAAVIQPFGESQVASALDNLGNSLTLVFAAVAAVGLMFFMALSIIIGLANLTVVLR